MSLNKKSMTLRSCPYGDILYCIRTLTRNSWIHYRDYWIVK